MPTTRSSATGRRKPAPAAIKEKKEAAGPPRKRGRPTKAKKEPVESEPVEDVEEEAPAAEEEVKENGEANGDVHKEKNGVEEAEAKEEEEPEKDEEEEDSAKEKENEPDSEADEPPAPPPAKGKRGRKPKKASVEH